MIKRLGKLPKRKVTVDELLGQDDIKRAIDDLQNNINNIEELVIIYTERGSNDVVTWHNNFVSRFIYLLEFAKNMCLNRRGEEDEDE